MPVSRALRNLLKVRNLETEQRRVMLKSAMSELHVLQDALAHARTRRTGARAAALELGLLDVLDRSAFLLQQDTEARLEKALEIRRSDASERAEDARVQFMQKRTEQRQAETLVQAAEKRETADMERRLQRTIDEQHMRRASAARKR